MSNHETRTTGHGRELRMLWYPYTGGTRLDAATIDEAMRRGRRERAEIFAAAGRGLVQALRVAGAALLRGVNRMQERRAATSLTRYRLDSEVRAHYAAAARSASSETQGVLSEPEPSPATPRRAATPMRWAA